MRRGEIRWASLRDPQDSALGFRRPVPVVQSTEFKYRLTELGEDLILALDPLRQWSARWADSSATAVSPGSMVQLRRRSAAAAVSRLTST